MLVNSTNGEFFSRLPAAVSAGVTLGVSLGVDDDERADLLPATSVRAPLRHERNFAMSSHDHGYFAMARDAQTLIGLRRIDVVHLSPGARIKYHGRVGVLLKPPRASDGKSCVRFSRTPEGPSTSSDAAQPPSTTFRDRDLECCLPARAPSPSSVAAPALLALTVPTRICAALVQTACREKGWPARPRKERARKALHAGAPLGAEKTCPLQVPAPTNRSQPH